MKDWLWKYKGYIVHGAVIGIVFLNPSVRTYFGAHTAYAGPGLLAWGWVLHWAEGK